MAGHLTGLAFIISISDMRTLLWSLSPLVLVTLLRESYLVIDARSELVNPAISCRVTFKLFFIFWEINLTKVLHNYIMGNWLSY